MAKDCHIKFDLDDMYLTCECGAKISLADQKITKAITTHAREVHGCKENAQIHTTMVIDPSRL